MKKNEIVIKPQKFGDVKEKIGAGKIFTSDVDAAVRIRAGAVPKPSSA